MNPVDLTSDCRELKVDIVREWSSGYYYFHISFMRKDGSFSNVSHMASVELMSQMDGNYSLKIPINIQTNESKYLDEISLLNEIIDYLKEQIKEKDEQICYM